MRGELFALRPGADLALVSHVVVSRWLQANLNAALRLAALADLCMFQPAFPRARPLVQQGAPAVCCQTPARDLL